MIIWNALKRNAGNGTKTHLLRIFPVEIVLRCRKRLKLLFSAWLRYFTTHELKLDFTWLQKFTKYCEFTSLNSRFVNSQKMWFKSKKNNNNFQTLSTVRLERLWTLVPSLFRFCAFGSLSLLSNCIISLATFQDPLLLLNLESKSSIAINSVFVNYCYAPDGEQANARLKSHSGSPLSF